jgi:hypothetical protein
LGISKPRLEMPLLSYRPACDISRCRFPDCTSGGWLSGHRAKALAPIFCSSPSSAVIDPGNPGQDGLRSTCPCQGSGRSEVTSSPRQNPHATSESSLPSCPQTDGLGRLICRHVQGWPTGSFAVKCYLDVTLGPVLSPTPCLARSMSRAPTRIA